MNFRRLFLVAGFGLSCCLPLAAVAQGTAFTYQGWLQQDGSAATGLYDIRFSLYHAAEGGAPVTGSYTVNGHPVSDGLFTVTLNFGDQFPGADRWLEIGVKTNGAASFETLAPRHYLAATPYAITARNLSGALPASQLPAGVVTNGASGLSLAGTFSGDGAGLTNLNAWRVGGNAGTTPGASFIGTTDNQPLEVKVNGNRALRLEPNAASPNIVGGYSGNIISNGVVGGFIGGGGAATYPNRAGGSFATVPGGLGNVASGELSTAMGSGSVASGDYSTAIGFGTSAQAPYSTAMGQSTAASGRASTAMGRATTATGPNSTAMGWISTAGGSESTAMGWLTTASGAGSTAMGILTEASGDYSTALGANTTASGSSSTAMGSQAMATGPASIAMGQGTTASGSYSTAMGENATASGFGATAMGRSTLASGIAALASGENTTATNYAFAAGHRARANHQGTFVWADSQTADFASTAENQVLIRAFAGVGINKNDPASALDVAGTITANTLSVSDSLRSPGAGPGTTTPVFIHVATADNIEAGANHRTTIHHPLCDGDPNAILILTQNYNARGVGNVGANYPIGVYYNPGLARWQIFNQDVQPIAANTAWNVLVFKP